MESLPFMLLLAYALYSGLTHAFEADHVLAVSTLVSQRDKTWVAVKDGIFWGLGHSSTIFVVGILMLIFKLSIPEGVFSYFEAFVGFMLIMIALYRIRKFVREEGIFLHRHSLTHRGANSGLHVHVHTHAYGQVQQRRVAGTDDSHKAAYGIGLVHGLAGSGALIVLVMAKIPSMSSSLLYLLTFGVGSIVGMTLVASVFSIPFSKRLISSRVFRVSLIMISSILCFSYGGWVIYSNLIG